MDPRFDLLEEWRNAAACARGRFRPDGYGCYRRGSSRFGFFLEFDRGTEKPREYAAKLATYYGYRDAGTANRDYTGFPTLLVVTTSMAAETRFAHQAHQRHAASPVAISESRVQGNCVHGLMSGDWKRGTVSAPQRLQPTAWTAPDLFGHRASPRLYPGRGRRG